jgi:hypothetical protein
VPTFKEVGLEPVNRMAYYGMLAPRALPKEVVDKVNAGVRRCWKTRRCASASRTPALIVMANTPEQFAAADQGRVRGVQEGGGQAEAQAGLSGPAVAKPMPLERRGPVPFLPAASRAIDRASSTPCGWRTAWRNTLAAYRRDLTLYAHWLADQHRPRCSTHGRAATCWPTSPSAMRGTRATTANRRLTVFKRYFRWALRERW